MWVFSIFDYKIPSYSNGRYEYPEWAHHLGWTITGVALLCLPTFAIFNISKSEGSGIFEVWKIPTLKKWRPFLTSLFFSLQKIKKTLQPNIYECKICGEHHCQHDFPEEAIQEMLQTTPIILQTPPISHQPNNHHVTIISDKPDISKDSPSSSKNSSDNQEIEIVSRPLTNNCNNNEISQESGTR